MIIGNNLIIDSNKICEWSLGLESLHKNENHCSRNKNKSSKSQLDKN